MNFTVAFFILFIRAFQKLIRLFLLKEKNNYLPVVFVFLKQSVYYGELICPEAFYPLSELRVKLIFKPRHILTLLPCVTMRPQCRFQSASQTETLCHKPLSLFQECADSYRLLSSCHGILCCRAVCQILPVKCSCRRAYAISYQDSTAIILWRHGAFSKTRFYPNPNSLLPLSFSPVICLQAL